MTSPESEVLALVAERISALVISLDEALQVAGPAPATLQSFGQRSMIERVASKSVVKSVEQVEEQLARLFRTILQVRAIDTNGWYAQDIANHMEKIGIVADAATWVNVIKLRNRLVHDYPIDPQSQFSKLLEAYKAADFLRETAGRAIAYVKEHDLI